MHHRQVNAPFLHPNNWRLTSWGAQLNANDQEHLILKPPGKRCREERTRSPRYVHNTEGKVNRLTLCDRVNHWDAGRHPRTPGRADGKSLDITGESISLGQSSRVYMKHYTSRDDQHPTSGYVSDTEIQKRRKPQPTLVKHVRLEHIIMHLPNRVQNEW